MARDREEPPAQLNRGLHEMRNRKSLMMLSTFGCVPSCCVDTSGAVCSPYKERM